ncbi:MAG: heme ABC transporter ATP-binding protein [Chloroflexota bacterium]
MSLVADRVVVRIGGAELLKGASMELHPGELLAVVGPNGAGKSTLLRALAGDRPVDGGEVRLDGRPLAAWSLPARARRRAVMGHEEELAFPWRAREVVMLGRTPHHSGSPSERDHAIVGRLLADVEATGFAERTYPTLSGGEKQRIQIARILAQLWPIDLDPQVPWATGGGAAAPADRAGDPTHPGHAPIEREAAWLLLDEPTANLDLRHQSLALRLLRRRAALGAGILVVLHDLNLAAAHADRIVVVHAGQVVADGPPADVLRPELLAEVFGLPMLVVPDARLPHPLVVPDPTAEV